MPVKRKILCNYTTVYEPQGSFKQGKRKAWFRDKFQPIGYQFNIITAITRFKSVNNLQ